MLKKNIAISLCLLGLFLPLSIAHAGTVLSTHKYAWSDKVGYINFEHVTVNGNALSGYAWSANKGFIIMNPALSGVLNDGTGNLSGSAWGDQLGYIDFNGVSINSSNGQFSGTATGDLVGTITFNCPSFCDVQTDWRQISVVVTPPPFVPVGNGIGGVGVAPAPNVSGNVVDISDFNAMMVNWGSTVCGNPADLNKDCHVDIIDFNILMVHWGTVFNP